MSKLICYGFFSSTQDEIKAYLYERCSKQKQIKFRMVVHVEMMRVSNDGETDTSTPYFHSETYSLLTKENNDDMQHKINKAFQKQFQSFDEYIAKGSGWTLKKVLSLSITTVKYAPIRGRKYFSIPKTLRTNVINMQNQDNRCFMWAVLCGIHKVDSHPERISHYRRFENELNFKDIDFPVRIDQINKFEKQNPTISINVFGYEDNQLFPLYISKMNNGRHEIDLLYIKSDADSHYCYIPNLARFLSRTRSSHRISHFCRRCLQGFTSEKVLKKHLKACSNISAQHVELPEEDVNDICSFTDISKQLKCGFVIYADFECFSKRLQMCENSPEKSHSTPVSKFEACSYCFVTVCNEKQYSREPVLYRGSDPAKHFLENLIEEEARIKHILAHPEPMKMTKEDKDNFKLATHCYLCKKKMMTKVRDHCHLTGKYRGAACQKCNLNMKHPKYIPVLIHNLASFDSFIIEEALGLFKSKQIRCIPKTMQKYISFTLGNLKFIDSYQFMNCSLSKMVENLANKNKENPLSLFPQLCSAFKDKSKATLLLRKGVYCYEYCNSFDTFKETELPEKEKNYNNLTNEHLSDEDYDFAKTVWREYSVKNLGEFHDIYLISDTVLLADCFESFRDICLKSYGLDCVHYVSLPGYAWASALRMSKCKLQLLTDIDMYLFIENSIRGGLSVISKRKSTCNNKYVPETYDSSKEAVYIMYFDCTSLYSTAMRYPLPTHDFKWMTRDEINALNFDEIDSNADTGYILEVDIDYPTYLHDMHADYPLLPEHVVITEGMLSDYCKTLFKKEHFINEGANIIENTKTSKLVTMLNDKKIYILHISALKSCLEQGLKIKKIHRVLSFSQSPFLKCFIDFNTDKRKNAHNSFEDTFYKWVSNATFGKTMENLRNRVQVDLVHTQKSC